MYVCACMYVCMCATCMYAWPCRILYGLSLNSTARLQKVIRSSTPESDYEGLNRQPFKTLDLWVPFKGSLEGSLLREPKGACNGTLQSNAAEEQISVERPETVAVLGFRVFRGLGCRGLGFRASFRYRL